MNLFDFILIFDLFIDDLYGIISAIKFISKSAQAGDAKL